MRRRSARDEFAAELDGSSVLLHGDAGDLLRLIAESPTTDGVPMIDAARGLGPGAGAEVGTPRLALIAVRREPGRSALAKATVLAGELRDRLGSAAVRLVIVEARRSAVTPDLVRSLLLPEIVHQIVRASHAHGEEGRTRRLRESIGLTLLEASGLTVLRIG